MAGPNTKVFATLQTPPDDWFAGTAVAFACVDKDGYLIVNLTKAADRDLWVAWLLLE